MFEIGHVIVSDLLTHISYVTFLNLGKHTHYVKSHDTPFFLEFLHY